MYHELKGITMKNFEFLKVATQTGRDFNNCEFNKMCDLRQNC